MMAADSIAVGNRRTSPVSRNSRTTGVTRPIDNNASATNELAKNINGRSSFTRTPIIFKMRKPSRMVLSLEVDPSGRSL